MRRTAFYLTACCVAALAPFVSAALSERHYAEPSSVAPDWPMHFENRALVALPLTEREQRFGRGFPGHLARFTDGEREIIIRRVTAATRKLHPAADCFAAVGYEIHPRPLHVDAAGHRWGSFTATRRGDKLRVYERIYTNAGESWTDVSAWYWAAEETAGPWWAVTVAEKGN